MSKRVLCLLAPGFEEIETVTPIDLLRRAGAEVVIASINGEKLVTGRSNLTLQADVPLAEVAEQEFDLLLIPGGPGVKTLRSDGRPARLAATYARVGRPVAAICAAPTILKDAGLLEGRRFTAHSSVHGELPGVLGAERVVEDGHLITSRGAGTALDFGFALVRRLFGDEKAREVAHSIMA
jgi:protein deglycase